MEGTYNAIFLGRENVTEKGAAKLAPLLRKHLSKENSKQKEEKFQKAGRGAKPDKVFT